jgi:hypothetical protein
MRCTASVAVAGGGQALAAAMRPGPSAWSWPSLLRTGTGFGVVVMAGSFVGRAALVLLAVDLVR